MCIYHFRGDFFCRHISFLSSILLLQLESSFNGPARFDVLRLENEALGYTRLNALPDLSLLGKCLQLRREQQFLLLLTIQREGVHLEDVGQEVFGLSLELFEAFLSQALLLTYVVH